MWSPTGDRPAKRSKLNLNGQGGRRCRAEFVGDFLDFAWAAVELGRKLPNSEKLRLPHNKNALGERLARKNRTKSR
jgi:hypothetical protein